MDLGEGVHELVRGEIVTMSPPQMSHGIVCFTTANLLHDFGRRTGHGYVATNDSTVLIDDENVRGADVCYYSEARWPRARALQERPPVPPDLAVEVLSPSDRPGETRVKVGDYHRAGVVVWGHRPGEAPADDPSPRRPRLRPSSVKATTSKANPNCPGSAAGSPSSWIEAEGPSRDRGSIRTWPPHPPRPASAPTSSLRWTSAKGVHELIRGEIVPVSPPEYLHGQVAGLTFFDPPRLRPPNRARARGDM